MEGRRPGPGEQIQDTTVAVPRLAATVILLRGGDRSLEVLLVRRNPQARFMGGAWVFPGGSVDRSEGEGEAALRAAAVRELDEEAGIALPAGQELVAFARWITPERVSIRFDTWFFLAHAPAGAEPTIDGSEVVDAGWYSPAGALAAEQAGELLLVFPTRKQLEQLSAFGSAQQLIDYARGQEIHPVQPQVLGQGETARIVLPGESDYEE